jgi:hypothetical protein
MRGCGRVATAREEQVAHRFFGEGDKEVIMAKKKKKKKTKKRNPYALIALMRTSAGTMPSKLDKHRENNKYAGRRGITQEEMEGY